MFLPFQPEISNCNNKWCENHGSFPTTGMEPIPAMCSSYNKIELERIQTGGKTGRGVTPCNLGFIQVLPKNSKEFIQKPYSNQTLNILFDKNRPGYLPPQGNVRSFVRIGNEWRNN